MKCRSVFYCFRMNIFVKFPSITWTELSLCSKKLFCAYQILDINAHGFPLHDLFPWGRCSTHRWPHGSLCTCKYAGDEPRKHLSIQVTPTHPGFNTQTKHHPQFTCSQYYIEMHLNRCAQVFTSLFTRFDSADVIYSPFLTGRWNFWFL